ncbi:MAG: LysR family transcriptional regulator [Oscillospiraceae bacterium]
MNLLHLKYAVEVEKTASITQAATNLYMNQPHLSKAIRELEKNLKITIFNRTSKGVIQTKKGKVFLINIFD